KEVLAPLGSDARAVDPKALFRQVFGAGNGGPQSPEECINLCLYFEAKTFLHGLLVVEDKLSMAHGLETRVPMLDNELVDFALRVPVRYKLGELNGGVRLDENIPGPKIPNLDPALRHGK